MDAHHRDYGVPRRSGRDFHHHALTRALVRLAIRSAGSSGWAGRSKEERDLGGQRRGELLGPGNPAVWQSDDEVTGAACDAGEADDHSHFVNRDRMGRTMAFVARALKDGLTPGGKAWGVGIEEGGSLYIDKNGLATLSGANAYVILGDHQPEKAVSGQPLTFSNFKIWRLTSGQNYDFKNRPACGYYLRSVTNGVTDSNLYNGTPVTSC
ncbi:hypothetical protein OG264_38155 [Streptomyces xanthophaeus]|uniref:hypothetical protein n=1 Tax=Streptomyces xanthophaeus TaxID=67385 RepID=UPI00386AB890|nr:hypothetical protein OG264_38155 [Streptomyces xanthophaeus]WST58206.1 hypothetical protein OG605_00280 [Streptomyces xanthophaeus]